MASDTSSPRMLSKDDIWGVDDIQEKVVDVPLWGGSIRIRSLTLEQISEIRAHAVRMVRGKEEVDNKLQMAGLLCEGIIEPELNFSEAQRMMKKSAAATSILIAAINELSGLLPEDVDEAEKSTDSRSSAAISVLPGSRTEDDTSGHAEADVNSRVQSLGSAVPHRSART